MYSKLALRDAVLITISGMAWWWLAGTSALGAGGSMLGDLTGLVVGLMVGACIYLLHEWGHALGGFATGATLHPPASLKAISLFSFDSKRNTKRQFTVMSLSGFVVTALGVAFAYGVLPDGQLATHVARGVSMLLAALTLFLEIPILIIGLVRSELPPVETFEPVDLSGSQTAG